MDSEWAGADSESHRGILSGQGGILSGQGGILSGREHQNLLYLASESALYNKMQGK